MAHLVFARLFDRLPSVKIITHHFGGMIPYFEGRVGPGRDQLGSRTCDVDYTLLLKQLKKRPLDYFRMFYADTAVFGSEAATICGLKFFGADRVLFGSESPFDPEKGSAYIRRTIDIINRLPITDAEPHAIFQGNARELLKLS
jgi:aminocarboxymuconate-semialdehyde decarboxylase